MDGEAWKAAVHRVAKSFSSCDRCSRLTMGTSGTRSGCLRKGQSPCELLGGLSGFLSRRCWVLRPCVAHKPFFKERMPGTVLKATDRKVGWGELELLSSKISELSTKPGFPLENHLRVYPVGGLLLWSQLTKHEQECCGWRITMLEL